MIKNKNIFRSNEYIYIFHTTFHRIDNWTLNDVREWVEYDLNKIYIYYPCKFELFIRNKIKSVLDSYLGINFL